LFFFIIVVISINETEVWLNRIVPNGECRRRKARSEPCGELTRRRNRGGCRRGESEEAWWVGR